MPPFEHGHVDDPVLLSGPGPAARRPPARSERHGVDHLSHLIWSSASCSCRLGLPSCTRPGGWSQHRRHCVASTSVWLAVRVVRPGRRTGRDGHAATGRCSYRRQTAERVAWPSLRRRDRGVRQQRSVQSIVGNRTRWVNALTPPHRELLGAASRRLAIARRGPAPTRVEMCGGGLERSVRRRGLLLFLFRSSCRHQPLPQMYSQTAVITAGGDRRRGGDRESRPVYR